MQSGWRREGDFYHYSDDREVRYICEAKSAIITAIDIKQCKQSDKTPTIGHGYITLYFSPFHSDTLISVCKQLDIPYEKHETSFTRVIDENKNNSENNYEHVYGTLYYAHLSLNKNTLHKIMQLFAKFNRDYDPQPFANDIQQELLNACCAVEEVSELRSHSIPAATTSTLPIDNKRPTYKKLVDMLAYKTSPYSICKKYLMEGDNPNEQQNYGDHDTSGHTPLAYAIIRHKSDDLLELLLWYGANPFKRAESLVFGRSSPLELAKIFGLHSKINTIIAAFSKASRPLTTASSHPAPLKVIRSQLEYEKQCIITTLDFSNHKTLQTVIKPLDKLSAEERAGVFAHFKIGFEITTEKQACTIETVFDDDFSGKKTIELIYDGEHLIGFNLFEVITPEKSKDNVFLHCAYAYLSPDYRGYGLMTYLAFRPAYSLQLLLEDKKVGVFFCSIHYNSYRLVDFQHFPKYQPDYMPELANEVLDDVLQADYAYYHDLITYYIFDRVRVKGPNHATSYASLNERLFRKEILGMSNQDHEQTHTKAAPILFYIGDENTNKMRITARYLGIDFDSHAIKLAEYMQLLLKNITKEKLKTHPINPAILSRSSLSLFWNKESPAASVTHDSTDKCQARL